MEFEFTTTKDSAMQILKTWNIRLLESFAFNPQQLNEIASVINPSAPTPKKEIKSKTSKSFRKSKPNNKYHQDNTQIKRSGSFSKTQTFRTDLPGAGVAMAPGSAGNSPAVMRNQHGELVRVGGLPPLPREANVRSWGSDDQYNVGAAPLLSNLSQESYGRGSAGASPPPLPPRPSDRLRESLGNRNGEDPDYAYIREEEIKPPPSRPLDPLTSVDDALNELEKDIMRANEARRIEEEDKRRREARQRSRLSDQFPLRLGPQVVPPTISEPQDYMDFVPQDYTDFKPTKTQHSMSVSSDPDKPPTAGPAHHMRSASEPEPLPYPSSTKTHSQPPVFEDDEDTLRIVGLHQPPLGQKPISKSSHHLSSRSQSEQAFSIMGPIPSLPPRTWRNATSSGNIDSDPSVVAGGSTASSSSLLFTMAENRPRTSQDIHTGVSHSLDKPLTRGSSDLSIPQYSSVQKPHSFSRISDSRINMPSVPQHGATPSVQSAPILPMQPGNTQSRTTAFPSAPAHSSAIHQVTSAPSSHFTTTSLPSTLSSHPVFPSSTTTNTVSQAQRDPITFQTKPSTPPPIPPRSPTKDLLSRKSSSSSSSSNSSNRCHHCRGSRRNHKAQVSKTVSLGAALSSNQSPDNCRKSLPDLAGSDKTVFENQLNRHGQRSQRSRHCSRCSPESSMETLQDGLGASVSTSSLTGSALEYLQLVGEEQGSVGNTSSKSDMDLMSSCMKYLDFLNREIDVTVSLSNHGAAVSEPAVVPSARPTMSSSRPLGPLSSSVTSQSRPKPTTIQPSPAPGSMYAQANPPSFNQAMANNKKKGMGVDRKSLEMNLNRAQLEAQMTLASLSQPLHSTAIGGQSIGLLPVSSHMDVRTSPVLNYGHPSNSSNTRHNSITTSAHTMVTRASRSPQNGAHAHRSASTTALPLPTNIHSSAPPIVPPRSMVSLKQDSSATAAPPTNKRQMSPRASSSTQLRTRTTSVNLPSNRRVSGGPPTNQQPSMRSPRINSKHGSLMRPARQMDHVDPGQSSTVFIHHLKSGLAHLV